ncbi:hypothetical protein NDU88_001342 [Pleurodeles waltl]|uniref:Uncharacterized protein n=1 Tax=Pleurodeles waltl TaxID=8319 RepID=A0AAV7P7N0_PLEWA|nr:hypothetical protein NDU88_001342 [Pleurodeles waltl]
MRRRCARDRRQNIGGMKGGRRGPGLLLGIFFRWRIGPVSGLIRPVMVDRPYRVKHVRLFINICKALS